MSNKRFAEEFKMEAIKQVTERDHPVAEVASRPGGYRIATCTLGSNNIDWRQPSGLKSAVSKKKCDGYALNSSA